MYLASSNARYPASQKERRGGKGIFHSSHDNLLKIWLAKQPDFALLLFVFFLLFFYLLAKQPPPLQSHYHEVPLYLCLQVIRGVRQHMSAYVSMPAYVSIRQHTSAYVSIRRHTSGCVSIPVSAASAGCAAVVKAGCCCCCCCCCMPC